MTVVSVSEGSVAPGGTGGTRLMARPKGSRGLLALVGNAGLVLLLVVLLPVGLIAIGAPLALLVRLLVEMTR